MKAKELKDGVKEMDMFREEVSIDLYPFYCCGCGSCGLSQDILLSVRTASAMLNAELATH